MIDTSTTTSLVAYHERDKSSRALDDEQDEGEFDPALIPPEILEKYFGPQNLFGMSMGKTEQNLLIEINRIFKDTYFAIFHDTTLRSIQQTGDDSEVCGDTTDGFPRCFLKVPLIEELLHAFEDQLSTFNFERVSDFESYVDTIVQLSLQFLQQCNLEKKRALDRLKVKVRGRYLEALEGCFNRMSKEQQIAFFVLN